MQNPERDTPYTVIDYDRLVANLQRHQVRTQQQGIAARPHAKTHKTPQISKLQLDYGARGITLATIGEAEVFVDAGVTDIFLAYPLWLTPNKARRLQAIAVKARIAIGVDSVDGAPHFLVCRQVISELLLIIPDSIEPVLGSQRCSDGSVGSRRTKR